MELFDEFWKQFAESINGNVGWDVVIMNWDMRNLYSGWRHAPLTQML